MPNTLPLPVVRYLAARTPDQIADCFTENGVAVDESRTRTGRAEIRIWREEVAAVPYRQDILDGGHDGEKAWVSARISGDFKGSPVTLDYRFDLADDLIARLEIS